MFDFLTKIQHNIENIDAEGWWSLALMLLTSVVFIVAGVSDYYKNKDYYDNLSEEEKRKWMHYPPGL